MRTNERHHDEPCDQCAGTGWVSFPDPAHDGDLIDSACPCGGRPAMLADVDA